MEETETAFKIGDKEEKRQTTYRDKRCFENNASDYGRKLYLIENCIYGIDIQPYCLKFLNWLRFSFPHY